MLVELGRDFIGDRGDPEACCCGFDLSVAGIDDRIEHLSDVLGETERIQAAIGVARADEMRITDRDDGRLRRQDAQVLIEVVELVRQLGDCLRDVVVHVLDVLALHRDRAVLAVQQLDAHQARGLVANIVATVGS